MIHHQRSLDIDATPEAVWAVIARYMHIDEFAPFVVSVDALTDGENGMGSKRRNHFDNGTSIVEEVIEWEPGRGYRIRGSEFAPLPFHVMLAGVFATQLSSGRSTVTWSIGYRVKYGPFGWLLGQTVMKRALGKVLHANLKGLADKVESDRLAAAQAT